MGWTVSLFVALSPGPSHARLADGGYAAKLLVQYHVISRRGLV